MAVTAFSEQELLQICRRYEIPCPVCGTANTHYRLKPDIVRPTKTEGDGHPLGYRWSKPGFDTVDPKRFFWGVCSKCRFTGELEDADFRQAAKLGEEYTKEFRPDGLRLLIDGGDAGKGLAQSLGKRLRDEQPLLAAVARFHLGIFSQTLRLRVVPGNLARFYLRIAWLYRDQPAFYPEETIAGIVEDLEPLTKRWERDLPEHPDYPARPTLALDEVTALRLSRACFERNYETLREARREEELRLRQLLAEIGYRIYELTSQEDDFRKASSFYSGIMQQCLSIISDKSIVGGVVNRAREMLESVGDRGRELRELHKARGGAEGGEAESTTAAGKAKKTAPAKGGSNGSSEAAPKAAPAAPPVPAAGTADQRELDQARRQTTVMQEELETLRTRVKELEEDSKKWRQLAGRDTVTGLPNKTMLFRLVIPKVLRELDRVGPVSCIAVSFEHVGQVNQQHGWLMGDRMLKESAAGLRKYVQEGEELYRLDGVHFVIVGPMSQNAAKTRAAEMRRRLAQANVQVEKTQLPMVASLGVVTVEKVGGTAPSEVASALYAALLTTLYKAKEKGGNSVEVYATTRF